MYIYIYINPIYVYIYIHLQQQVHAPYSSALTPSQRWTYYDSMTELAVCCKAVLGALIIMLKAIGAEFIAWEHPFQLTCVQSVLHLRQAAEWPVVPLHLLRLCRIVTYGSVGVEASRSAASPHPPPTRGPPPLRATPSLRPLPCPLVPLPSSQTCSMHTLTQALNALS